MGGVNQHGLVALMEVRGVAELDRERNDGKVDEETGRVTIK